MPAAYCFALRRDFRYLDQAMQLLHFDFFIDDWRFDSVGLYFGATSGEILQSRSGGAA